MLNQSLKKNSSDSWKDKVAHTFLRPKVNVILRQEFELVYYDVLARYVSHYTTEIDLYSLN